MNKRYFLVLLVTICSSVAWCDESGMTQAQKNVANSIAIIESVSESLLSDLKENKENLAENGLLRSLIKEHIIPVTDLESVSNLIVGEYWTELSAKQREGLKAGFGQLIVNTYATVLASYDGEVVEIKDAVAAPNNPELVRVSVSIKGISQTVNVSYYLHEVDGKMAIYDNDVNGSQFTKTYRTSYQQFVSTKNITAMLDNLNGQNSLLKVGARVAEYKPRNNNNEILKSSFQRQ